MYSDLSCTYNYLPNMVSMCIWSKDVTSMLSNAAGAKARKPESCSDTIPWPGITRSDSEIAWHQHRVIWTQCHKEFCIWCKMKEGTNIWRLRIWLSKRFFHIVVCLENIFKHLKNITCNKIFCESITITAIFI